MPKRSIFFAANLCPGAKVPGIEMMFPISTPNTKDATRGEIASNFQWIWKPKYVTALTNNNPGPYLRNTSKGDGTVKL
jgi:hypothetical protein